MNPSIAISEAKRKEQEVKKDIERFLKEGGKIKNLNKEKAKEVKSNWRNFDL